PIEEPGGLAGDVDPHGRVRHLRHPTEHLFTDAERRPLARGDPGGRALALLLLAFGSVLALGDRLAFRRALALALALGAVLALGRALVLFAFRVLCRDVRLVRDALALDRPGRALATPLAPALLGSPALFVLCRRRGRGCGRCLLWRD